MGQIVSDDFNRADGALGANWTIRATSSDSGATIVSNQCKDATASGNAVLWYSGAGWTGGNDQYAEATIIALQSGNDFGVCARLSGASIGAANGYLAVINSTDAAVSLGGTIQCSFYKVSAGSFTQIGTDFGVTISANDVIRLEVQGTTLRLKVNGVQRGTDTDASIASGNPGLYFAGSSTASIWDAFAAGDFSGGGRTTKNTRSNPLGVEIGMNWQGNL